MVYHNARTTGPVIAVIDGMGGGIGAQIVTQLRQALPAEVEILALGANAVATQRMMQARASRGASGENAIRISIREADFILAPIGVVIPNSMMGEITVEIASAVACAQARKLLLPVVQPHFELIGIERQPLAAQISLAVDMIRQALQAEDERD
jgi:antitoxin component of MazEF toxin-antitoxin module